MRIGVWILSICINQGGCEGQPIVQVLSSRKWIPQDKLNKLAKLINLRPSERLSENTAKSNQGSPNINSLASVGYTHTHTQGWTQTQTHTCPLYTCSHTHHTHMVKEMNY